MRRQHASTAVENTSDAQSTVASLQQFLDQLKNGPVSEALQEQFAAEGASLQGKLVDAPMPERLALLRQMSDLGTLPGKPYAIATYFFGFLESYTEDIDTLRDGETIVDRAMELRHILYCFHRGGINTERLRLIYAHIEQDFPRYEAMNALLPMPAAITLCHTMLSIGLSSPPAIVTLLRAALREPLMHFADDSKELRQLKMIELLLRVDFLHTLEQLPPEVTEYLSIVRSLRYYDRDLRRDTALSYQLAYFLRKHNFPAKRHMLGPYALKISDPEERINFEPVEERQFRPGMTEEPPARKQRHLEAVGWRSFQVKADEWKALDHDGRAHYVRELLRKHSLIDP